MRARPRRILSIALPVLALAVAAVVLSGGQAAARHTVHAYRYPGAGKRTGKRARRHPRVLLVGTYHGIRGRFRTIQSAVNAARRGDWILVAPGDYHERGVKGASEPAGVLIKVPYLHLRGMNRNRVIVDGTKPGAARCSSRASDQIFTAKGRDGVEPYKADGVYVENLTVCNYLTGNHGGKGNEIWWNGGDGSGKIGMGPYWGNYLTATSTYSNGVDNPRGEYGIFVSNSRGPGVIDHSYASNMGDAAYYIGACQDCNATLRRAHAQFSSLGLSSTNAGGNLVVESSEFDHNKTGPVSNSQNNDDVPSPQNGLCPKAGPGPLGIGICTIWRDNYIHDNNEPNVPGNSAGGLAGGAPVGTGAILAGSEYVAIHNNRIVRNGAWGILVADLPDQEKPPPLAHCQGGVYVSPPPSPAPTCLYQAFGNEITGNVLQGNGFFGNPTNGDLALATNYHSPGNCFQSNTDPSGLTSDPPAIQANPIYGCGAAKSLPPNAGDYGPLFAQAECAAQLAAPCPTLPDAVYPRATKVVLHMPSPQATMPNPCAGVPANPWCASLARHKHKHKHNHKAKHHPRRDPDHDGDIDRGGQE